MGYHVREKILKDSPEMKESSLEQYMSANRNKVLLALLVLAAGLRIYGLDQGFTYDEIMALVRYFKAPWKALLTVMHQPNHHPLYSICARACLLLFGEGEWVVRLPAFLAGVLTPPLVYLTGSRWINNRVGLAAALFAAVSKYMVWFSQDARGYSFMIFFTLAATHLFLSLAEKPGRAAAAAYVIAAFAAIYSHLYSGAVIGAHLIMSLALLAASGRRREGLRLGACSLAALAIAFLAYVPFIRELADYTISTGRFTQGRSLYPGFFYEMLNRWSAGEDHPLLSLLMIAPAAAGLVIMCRRHKPLAGVWLVSFLIGVVFPAVIGTFVYKRFYSYAMPGFFLAAAAGYDLILERIKRAPGFLLLMIIAPAVVVASLDLADYYRGPKQGFRPAAEWIKENASGRKVILPGISGHVFRYYLPGAETPGPDVKLEERMIEGSIVAFSYRAGLGDENLRLLEERCSPPVVFPSAGNPVSDVYVYRCD